MIDRNSYSYRNALASLEIEGGKLPEGGAELILSHANKEISHEEFLKRAIEIAIGNYRY